MRNILYMLFMPVICTMFFTSCEKDEAKVFFKGGTPPVLSSNTEVLNLKYEDENKVVYTLRWSNPNYEMNTGISSQNVKYIIEMTLVGASVPNGPKAEIAVENDVVKHFTAFDLNGILLNQLFGNPGETYTIDIRVIARIGDSKQTELASNVVSLTTNTYAIPPKVTLPDQENLWMVGDASPNGWDNPLKSPYDVIQKFTKVSETLYELEIDLPGGGGYKLLQHNGNWSTQYHMLDGGTWEGGDFEMKDSDPQFPGPPEAGKYKISVDFQRGKFFVTKL